jgi:hypothetical protein
MNSEPLTPNQKPKSCPPIVGILGCIVGLAVIVFGCFGPESQFSNGRWLPIIVGGVFFLAGLQVLRVTVFHRAAEGMGSSILAAIVYLAFSSVLLWAAFSKAGSQGEVRVGGIVHDALLMLGFDTKWMESPRIGQVLFLVMAIIAVAGGLSFLYRVVRRNRK